MKSTTHLFKCDKRTPHEFFCHSFKVSSLVEIVEQIYVDRLNRLSESILALIEDVVVGLLVSFRSNTSLLSPESVVLAVRIVEVGVRA